DWINELNSSQLRAKFEEKLSNMPGDESYFLLTTFANMALSRTDKDYDFVKTTTIDLFQLGFLSEKTQDLCSKDARSLLSSLTNKYPSLLSDILQKLRDNFVSVGKLSLYLFTDLKLHKWIPDEKDIVILSTWLHQYPLTSTENHLARLILTHLNWGFDENGSLYLPIDLHRRIAVLTVELTMKYVPDISVQNTSLLAEGIKQVSTIIRPQNAEHIFSLWAWNMISKLRLHQLDQTEKLCRFALLNPTVAFAHVPDMEVDTSLEILVIGTLQKQPIACYVATIMTLWGHSVPLIYSKGFSQLEILQYHCKYEQVLICLHHIIPLFLECVDSLLKSDKFISLVISLISADKSYMKMAKTFVYLWLSTLVLVPDWNKDQSVLFLMNVVISAAFFYPDAKVTVEHMFQNLFSNTSNHNAITSFGSFLNWATGSSNSISLLGKSTQSVWVAYQVLLTEQYNREIKTGLWHEILKELSAQPKISLDTAIKRACMTVKIQPFGANGLSIYRWSQQALDTPIEHPILSLLWQNFFALFLARVPTTSGFYKTLSLWLEEPRLHEPGLYLPALPPQYMSQKLVLLVQDDWTPWLEYIDYWAIQQDQIMAVQEWENVCCRNQGNYSQTEKNVSILPSEMAAPLQRIFKRLTTYEYPAPPPVLNRNQTIFNCIPKENIYNSNLVIDHVKPYLKIILDYAQTYNLMVSEHIATDSSFLELVPTLYRESEIHVVLHALCDLAPPNQKNSRSGTPPTVHCAGPAVITVKVHEAHINDGIDHMITQNRAEYENLLIRASQSPPSKVTQGCVFIDHLIAMLEHEITINQTNENTVVLYKIQESGVKLFYYLIDCYTEEAALCPPTKQLITTCLQKLGQLFINGEESQGLQLLSTIMQKPNLGGLLGPYFTPVAGSASTFLQMYQTVVEFSMSPNVDLCFVLLSKVRYCKIF
ncbi:Ectopic P granules protein 5 like protein, partial [Eufriesea mexicana]